MRPGLLPRRYRLLTSVAVPVPSTYFNEAGAFAPEISSARPPAQNPRCCSTSMRPGLLPRRYEMAQITPPVGFNFNEAGAFAPEISIALRAYSLPHPELQ